MNYNNIFAFIRNQKAFTAFMTTLVVLGSVSSVFAARGAQAETVFTKVSYVLSDPLSAKQSTHTIDFKNKATISSNDIKIDFYPNGSDKFTVGSLDHTDLTAITVGGTPWTTEPANSCSGATNSFAMIASDATSITVKPCNPIVSDTQVKFTLGSTHKFTNPTVVGNPAAFDIKISQAATNQSQKIKVMILPSYVAMTAKVDPIFTFQIASTASGTPVNGTSTTFTTQDNVIDFGTLVPNAVHTGAQKLIVSTNAINGFTVTAKSDSEFASANGATIDGFNYAAASNTPSLWTAPTSVLNNDRTWGHVGMTSNGNSALFNTANTWVGNFTSAPVPVFVYGSSTRNASTTVGYQIQISDLQEAATDYKTNIIYVATPQF